MADLDDVSEVRCSSLLPRASCCLPGWCMLAGASCCATRCMLAGAMAGSAAGTPTVQHVRIVCSAAAGCCSPLLQLVPWGCCLHTLLLLTPPQFSCASMLAAANELLLLLLLPLSNCR